MVICKRSIVVLVLVLVVCHRYDPSFMQGFADKDHRLCRALPAAHCGLNVVGLQVLRC